MRLGAISIAFTSLCLLIGLSACSGGGGGSGAIPSSPPNVSSGGNTSLVSSPSPHPLTNGDTLIYAGQLTQTFQSFPEVAPTISPSPEPTSVTTENVTQNVTVKGDQSLNGTPGLYDMHSVETDAYTSGLKTTTSTTDTYENFTASGGAPSQLLDYGSQFTDEAGDSRTTTNSPAAILDELPETAGAQWSNGAGASIQEAIAGNASGSSITTQRTINADGSYTESTTYPPNYSFPGYTGFGQIQESSDGSGSFAWVANGGAITLVYSKPVPQLSGPPQITIGVFGGLDPTSADPPDQVLQLASWYGSAPALYGETDLDLGVQPVPSSCKLSAQFPQSAAELQQTINRTDTILGYTETETTQNYVATGYGTVCTIFKDTQSLIYDFNGDQPFVFTSTPPLEITTLSETLSLQPGSNLAGEPASSPAEHTIRNASALNVSRVFRVGFDRAVSAVRGRRVAALIRAAQRLRVRGGAQ